MKQNNEIHFDGPFKLHESKNCVFDKEICDQHGIYLWVIKEKTGSNYISYIGETGRTFRKRLEEHILEMTSLDYRISDAEIRKEGEEKKSNRLIGALVLLVIFFALAVLSFMRLSLSILKSDLHELPPPPGIIVTDTYVSNGNVHAKVLRDPVATSIEQWFSDNNIDAERVTVIEEPFVSLKPSVVERKLEKLVSDYPLSESESLLIKKGDDRSFIISGTVFTPTAINFTQQINAIPGVSTVNVDTTALNVKAAYQIDNAELQKAALNRLVNKVSSQNVLFATNQEALSEVQLAKLEPLANDIKQLLTLADKTKTVVSIVVMGASDNSGSSARNRALSQKRAENVVNSLISLGVESDILIPVSLGELPLQKASMGRSVMLNVLISSEQ